MKTMSRVVLAATAVTLALGLTLVSASEAQSGRRGRAKQAADGPRMEQQGWARLELTDDQKAKSKEMRLENRKAAMLRRGEMASLRAQLQAEFLNDEVNESKVRSLSKQISDLRGRSDEARLEHRLAMLNLLTPEQRDKAQEMRLQGPRRGMGGPGFHDGRGGRGGMRGGPGFHRGGRGGRGGMRGGPGFHRGGRGGRGGMRGGPGAFGGGDPAECPFGSGGGPGGFMGDAGPGQEFGPWWLDGEAEFDGGPEAFPAPEETETN